MDNKALLKLIFIVVVLVQLAVPGWMIFSKERVIQTGKEFKFKTAPIDPNDPFRGKYITLNFAERFFEVDDAESWHHNQTVFVSIENDEMGFAKIQFVSKEEPDENNDFVKAKVGYVSSIKENDNFIHELNIEYPFVRFYMEESKAPLAESMFWEVSRDTTKTTYALVSVQSGKAVLKDVFIGDVSVKELLKEQP